MHTTFSTSVNNKQLPTQRANENANKPELYMPSEPLWNAVTVALEMGLPLLLTGEPGTGKTQLAHHIAWYFGLDKPLVFDAQTTSDSKDLFYRYDALAHFQYAQTGQPALSPEEIEDKFIAYQALGKAIKEKQRYVVLLDEIDKAPRDLPNNVLAALEDLEFKVPETGMAFKSEPAYRPIIVMTSNSEKNLPDPFLRRVAYYHITMDEIDLLGILSKKVEGLSETDCRALIDYYKKIREGRKTRLQKKPATAELIHWAGLLQKMQFPTAKLANLASLTGQEKAQLAISFSVLAKTKEDLAALKNLLSA